MATHDAPALEVERFVRARAAELAALRDAVRGARRHRLAHQTLAWHRRRRTLSHSARRAPASIRARLQRELSASGAQAPRRARRYRKHRARARFLASLRQLRLRRPDRLETHLWHAKRFHMARVPAADRVVADFCNDRGARSAFRAFAHASLAHDASYLDVVALAGPHAPDALAALLAPHDAARARALPVVAGTRVARDLVVLDPASGRAIAPADALFRARHEHAPPDADDLWLWVHPAASDSVADALRTAAAAATTHHATVVAVRRNQLQTLRVYGPRAGFVLGAVIERVDAPPRAWDVVRHARSPATSPPCAVVAGEMRDPRANFPPKRVQAMAAAARRPSALRALADASASAAAPPVSPIWSARAREACAPRADHAPHVPFLLLQRPGARRGLGAGWDLVVPAGWARPLWHSIMYANGARAAGLREVAHLALETGALSFPHDFLDSADAARALRAHAHALAAQHARRPPSKRVNYRMYRVHSPFYPDLGDAGLAPTGNENGSASGERDTGDGSRPSGGGEDKMAAVDSGVVRRPRKRRRSQWSTGIVARDGDASSNDVAAAAAAADFRVLRGRQDVCAALGLQLTNDRYGRVQVEARRVEEAEATSMEEGGGGKQYVRVEVRPNGRGTVQANAMLCLPTRDEMEAMIGGERTKEATEKICKRGDGRARRRCVGRVVSGGFSLESGGPKGVAYVDVDAIRQQMESATGGTTVRHTRGGAPSGHTVRVRLALRNTSSLQYRVVNGWVRM